MRPPPTPTPQACIGRGAHGIVFEGETAEGKAVAVKVTPVMEAHNGNELAAVSLPHMCFERP